MTPASGPAPAAGPVDAELPWAPPLGALRLLGDGRSAALLSPDGSVEWWCAPAFDSPPLCWRLLDPAGGTARFPGLTVDRYDDAPAAAVARTVLRDADGLVDLHDALLPRGDGVVLVRLLRRRSGRGPVVHQLRLGGFDAPSLELRPDGEVARGAVGTAEVVVRGGRHTVVDGVLLSEVETPGGQWTALVIGVGADHDGSVGDLLADVVVRAEVEQRRRQRSRLPRRHGDRALDALAVLRACTFDPTGAVVASPVTSLPEAPGHDRQFDYRYSWLRDASLSTAVAALLGHADVARRYLGFVHRAWAGSDLLDTPVLDVRGRPVPPEREVDGVFGWAGSRPVRVGNQARGQRQYDSLGLFVEAVSVYVQAGGTLDGSTWRLVRRLADTVAAEDPGQVQESSGVWELRTPRPLVNGDVGRWLVLDRALWIARGWRPWTRRGHWARARDVLAQRIVGAVRDDGLLPQAYDGDPPVPDASSLMAVAFGLLGRNDPRAGRLVDAVLERLGDGPYVHRYPTGADDGFSGAEGAFLPVTFLAVTALARLGRVDEARARLDRLCAALPRLLAEEVDPRSGALLGNTPLVWSHAELARAVYVLDAAERRARWGAAGEWAWRLQRYARLRLDAVT
ncbi:MAG TPA: glycoside hydrolase family 15 protein [Mycobacteriales bacterium]|nr:glycoside hydrolase family 15 protein [Mycobacteriales bacterium]